jgi:manganese/iron transport system substrate-binding protein
VRLGIVGLVAGIMLAGAGCSAGPPGPSETLRIVATTTVIADLVAHVGGDDVVVSSLVPKGGEVHTFDPSPGDVARVSEADVVFVNGLGLDEWAVGLARDADVPQDRIVELGEDLPDADYVEGEADPDGGHAGEAINPHLWLDVSYAARYVERITERLSVADPERAQAFASRGSAYAQRLAVLDTWARDQLASIPAANRRIVSFHDALPYFARAYGLEVVGVVVDAPGQDPSAGEIAALIVAIRSSGVRAIVSEAQFSSDLVRTIADETDATVVADLYTDTLGDPPVDSFEGLIRFDVETLLDALRWAERR